MSRKSIYKTIDKEQLYQDYIVDNMTLKDIAEKYGFRKCTMSNVLTKYGIKKEYRSTY